MHLDSANHDRIVHKLFLNAELKCNDCPLVSSGKFFAQTQVGLNGLIFGMASNLDVPYSLNDAFAVTLLSLSLIAENLTRIITFERWGMFKDVYKDVYFHDRRVNTKINYIHERALRKAYQDRTSTFEELLITDNSVSIHQRNLQLLVTEIYRTRMNLNPPFMKEIFVEREIQYNLRDLKTIF